MVEYKLYYFENRRGRCEIIRLVFVAGGQPFKEIKLNLEQFKALKPTLPFGRVPLVEIDGQPLPETFAIVRYLANKFGLAGKDDFERAWVDAIADQFKDYNELFIEYMLITIGFDQGDAEKVLREKTLPARDIFFPLLEKRIAENGTGFLVGNDLTWADLLITEHVNLLNDKFPILIDGFPKAVEYAKKIFEHPKIAEYVKQRPDTPA